MILSQLRVNLEVDAYLSLCSKHYKLRKLVCFDIKLQPTYGDPAGFSSQESSEMPCYCMPLHRGWAFFGGLTV